MLKKPRTYFSHSSLEEPLKPGTITFADPTPAPHAELSTDPQSLDNLPGYRTTLRYYPSLTAEEKASIEHYPTRVVASNQIPPAPSNQPLPDQARASSSQPPPSTTLQDPNINCPCAQQCYFKCTKGQAFHN